MTKVDYYKIKCMLYHHYIMQLLETYNQLAKVFNHPRMIYDPDKLSVDKLQDYFIKEHKNEETQCC